MIIEDKEYILATKPFFNGCSFKIIINHNNEFFIEPGCYCLINLLSGYEYEIYKEWVRNGKKPYNINASEELKAELLGNKPCTHCGGIKFEE